MNAVLAEKVFGGWVIGGFAARPAPGRPDAHRRGRDSLRRGADRVPRRPADPRQHGRGLLGRRAASPSSPTASSRTTASGSWASPPSRPSVYTHGSVSSLLVMYAINVFVTFSLTLIGMTRHWLEERGRDAAMEEGARSSTAPGAILCVVDPHHHDLREGLRGRLADDGRDGAARRPRLLDQAPLRARPRAAAPPGRAAPRHPGAPAQARARARSSATSRSP